MSFSAPSLFGQRTHEFSVGVGTTYYYGDLTDKFNNSLIRPAAAISYSKYLMPILKFRTGFAYGEVGAADAQQGGADAQQGRAAADVQQGNTDRQRRRWSLLQPLQAQPSDASSIVPGVSTSRSKLQEQLDELQNIIDVHPGDDQSPGDDKSPRRRIMDVESLCFAGADTLDMVMPDQLDDCLEAMEARAAIAKMEQIGVKSLALNIFKEDVIKYQCQVCSQIPLNVALCNNLMNGYLFLYMTGA